MYSICIGVDEFLLWEMTIHFNNAASFMATTQPFVFAQKWCYQKVDAWRFTQEQLAFDMILPTKMIQNVDQYDKWLMFDDFIVAELFYH